ncbi:MAG: outer membrane beta-barrel protein [Thermodesulfovibrionales bacterium]
MKFTPLLLIPYLCLILCFTSAPPCFAGDAEEIENIQAKELIPLEKVEVITLGSREKAEGFANELEKSGYKTMISTGDKGDYKVFILMDKKDRNLPDLSGYTSQGPTDKNKPSWEILGRQHRNVHASLTLSGIYTDNALNSSSDKTSDFSTILSPAIWILFPYSGQSITPLSLSLRTPGGRLLAIQRPEPLMHYQASLYYRTDIPLTSSSDGLVYGRIPAHTLNGKILLSGNRFSLFAEDQYEFSHLEQEAGIVANPDDQDRYDSNLFNILLSYTSRNRLAFQVGYSNFMIGYKSDLDSFRDRQDNGFSAAVSYKVSQRMSLIVDYRYLNIAYDDTNDLDSSEHFFMGGISWDITAKSKGLLMAGYNVKNFDRFSGSYESFSLEAQLDHRFTPKTSLLVNAYRKPNETNIEGTDFSLTEGLEVRLQHLLTSRLTSSAAFLIINEHYKEGPDFDEIIDSEIYQVKLALQYAFKRWLKGGIGYAYTLKNSSVSELEYRSNTLYFNITAAI